MSLTDVEDILKHDYKGPLQNLCNSGVITAAQLERGPHDSIHGDYAVIPAEVGWEMGVGSRLQGDVVPEGDSVAPIQTHVLVKRLFGVFKVGADEIEAMASDTGAFTRSITRRTKNLKNAVNRDYARQIWSAGNAAMAQCGTTTNVNIVQLAADTPEQVMINFDNGAKVDIGTDAAPASVAANRKVTFVDFDNLRITIDGAPVTTSGSHFVYRQGSGGVGGSATQRDLTGFGIGIDDTLVLQGVDPATVPKWAAFVDGASSTRPASENLLERAVNRCENRGDDMIDALIAEDGVYRYLVNVLKARQSIVNDINLKGGHTGIDFTFGSKRLPLIKDKDAPTATVHGVAWDSFAIYVQRDWGWENEQGSGGMLRLSPSRIHEYEAWWWSFRELGYKRRNANLRIDDLEVA